MTTDPKPQVDDPLLATLLAAGFSPEAAAAIAPPAGHPDLPPSGEPTGAAPARGHNPATYTGADVVPPAAVHERDRDLAGLIQMARGARMTPGWMLRQGCQWIEGDERGAPKCGKALRPGSPYCVAHAERSTIKGKPYQPKAVRPDSHYPQTSI